MLDREYFDIGFRGSIELGRVAFTHLSVPVISFLSSTHVFLAVESMFLLDLGAAPLFLTLSSRRSAAAFGAHRAMA